jgi:hypothetical protein
MNVQEVITYVEGLKERMTILEKAQGLQPTCLPTPKEVPRLPPVNVLHDWLKRDA